MHLLGEIQFQSCLRIVQFQNFQQIQVITMSLTRTVTVMKPTVHMDLSSTRTALKENPEHIKDIPLTTVVKLTRGALRNNFHYFCTDVTHLIEQFDIKIYPLELALLQGDIEETKILLENGAKLDGPEWDGFSPLEWIFWKSNHFVRKDLLQLVLEYGLDPKVQNDVGKNALHLLAHHTDALDAKVVEIAEILLKAKVNINEPDQYKLTPLHSAVFNRNKELVSYLINNYADVNSVDEFSRTPLTAAALHGHVEIIRLLLKNGADVLAKGGYGRTALHTACNKNFDKVIDLLMRKGADVNIEDDYGMTPFLKLNQKKPEYDACLNMMIREMAKLKFKGVKVSEKNMMFIECGIESREYFAECLKEMELMSKSKFYAPFTYYSVLKMSNSIRRLSYLTTNWEFLKGYEENLDKFAIYKSDLQEIMNEAKNRRDGALAIRCKLQNLFRGKVPDVVVRELTDKLCLEDFPSRWPRGVFKYVTHDKIF